MAKGLDFAEAAELLNRSKVVSIEPEPVLRMAGQWSLYRGEYRVHTSSYPFRLLYLQASATHQGMAEAVRSAFTSDTQVVYAPFLDTHTRKYHREIFEKSAKGFWSTRDYLRSFFRDELNTYLERLGELKPQFFIDPQVETPIGVKRKIPNPLTSFLREGQRNDEAKGTLAILVGQPGQGKTFMSQHLVTQLTTSSYVPIYISSSQWNSLATDSLRSLGKTITHSFRHFEAGIPWLEGQEDEFLRATLKVDLFRIIFDGFDEYILKNDGRVAVSDALEDLAGLAASTGTRILITSRASFWDANVDSDAFIRQSGSSVYRILPFDVQHARTYFSQRFHQDKAKTNRAAGLYGHLAAGDTEFVGRGFVLKLIADLVGGSPISDPPSTETGAIGWLMTAFCEREELRQDLPLSAALQLRTLSRFAAEVATGEDPTTLTLQFAVHEAMPAFDDQTISECVDRMSPHPLLTRQADDTWRWSQDQIFFILLGQWIIDLAESQGGQTKELVRFLLQLRLAPNELVDLAAMIVDLAKQQGADAKKIVRAILAVRHDPEHASHSGADKGLMSALVGRALDAYLPQGSSHAQRTAFLLDLCGRGLISELTLLGTLVRLDLSGVRFENCRFERLHWSNCTFDSNTTFRKCTFIGGATEYSKGFGEVSFDQCVFDADAQRLVSSERIKAGKSKYTEDDLRSDMKEVLDKFIVAGGPGLRTVTDRGLTRGRISGSKNGDQVLDSIRRALLASHALAGGGWAYQIEPVAQDAVRFYAANGVFTGILDDLFSRLRTKLCPA